MKINNKTEQEKKLYLEILINGLNIVKNNFDNMSDNVKDDIIRKAFEFGSQFRYILSNSLSPNFKSNLSNEKKQELNNSIDLLIKNLDSINDVVLY